MKMLSTVFSLLELASSFFFLSVFYNRVADGSCTTKLGTYYRKRRMPILELPLDPVNLPLEIVTKFFFIIKRVYDSDENAVDTMNHDGVTACFSFSPVSRRTLPTNSQVRRIYCQERLVEFAITRGNSNNSFVRDDIAASAACASYIVIETR